VESKKYQCERKYELALSHRDEVWFSTQLGVGLVKTALLVILVILDQGEKLRAQSRNLIAVAYMMYIGLHVKTSHSYQILKISDFL
jgi:hypothetical protein